MHANQYKKRFDGFVQPILTFAFFNLLEQSVLFKGSETKILILK